MVYIRYFSQGNPHTYGHIPYVYIWCTYGIFGREIYDHMRCIYMVLVNPIFVVFAAGRLSNILSHRIGVYIHAVKANPIHEYEFMQGCPIKCIKSYCMKSYCIKCSYTLIALNSAAYTFIV